MSVRQSPIGAGAQERERRVTRASRRGPVALMLALGLGALALVATAVLLGPAPQRAVLASGRTGGASWLALVPTLAHRVSLGKSEVIRHWAAVGAPALVALAVALAAGALLARRARTAACMCVLAALANALAWSLIVPPFQAPDENAHYAYVQQLAERATLPRARSREGPLSPREDAMLAALGTFAIAEHPATPAPASDSRQRAIEAVAARPLSARGSGDALTATNNPPLYYALEAVPYKLAGGRVLDKLAAMRALSAAIAALTALFVFMFVRELLPGSRWTWPAAALLAGFQPLFAFIAASVNNDDLLYPLSAAVLWAVARGFRRGLTPAGGALIGGLLGAGLVAKLTLLGFVPAVALALVLLARRAWPLGRARALRGLAWAVVLACAPIAVYTLLDHLVFSRGVIPGGVGGVPGAGARGFSLTGEIEHVVQLFLVPLGMRHQFAYLPLWDTWFKGFFGRFGWLDYGFPAWLYKAAAAVALLVCALAAGELARSRRALRARLGELCVYALALIGLCAEIGVESYRYLFTAGGVFEQARYLLPALALYAAIAALAIRFGGRRWGPVLGAALVVLAIGHDLYAQAITLARYYA